MSTQKQMFLNPAFEAPKATISASSPTRADDMIVPLPPCLYSLHLQVTQAKRLSSIFAYDQTLLGPDVNLTWSDIIMSEINSNMTKCLIESYSSK